MKQHKNNPSTPDPEHSDPTVTNRRLGFDLAPADLRGWGASGGVEHPNGGKPPFLRYVSLIDC